MKDHIEIIVEIAKEDPIWGITVAISIVALILSIVGVVK